MDPWESMSQAYGGWDVNATPSLYARHLYDIYEDEGGESYTYLNKYDTCEHCWLTFGVVQYMLNGKCHLHTSRKIDRCTFHSTTIPSIQS